MLNLEISKENESCDCYSSTNSYCFAASNLSAFLTWVLLKLKIEDWNNLNNLNNLAKVTRKKKRNICQDAKIFLDQLVQLAIAANNFIIGSQNWGGKSFFANWMLFLEYKSQIGKVLDCKEKIILSCGCRIIPSYKKYQILTSRTNRQTLELERRSDFLILHPIFAD